MSTFNVTRYGAWIAALSFPWTAPAAAAAEDAAQAFRAACSTCHSTNRMHRIGPSLVGIEGRLSGTAAGYDASPALRQAALRWDAQTLDRFLVAPGTVVPGTRMVMPGIRDPALRQALVAYVVGLRSD